MVANASKIKFVIFVRLLNIIIVQTHVVNAFLDFLTFLDHVEGIPDVPKTKHTIIRIIVANVNWAWSEILQEYVRPSYVQLIHSFKILVFASVKMDTVCTKTNVY